MGSAVLISPSILASDFARLGEEVRDVESAGADWIHVDVMDGHFVPNITIGPAVVRALRKVTRVPLDVHLMITDPWQYADAFLDAGADVLTFHAELGGDALGLIRKVKARGRRAAMSLNPDTPLTKVEPFLAELDMVLVMSVFPGFGGQEFMPEVLAKVRRLRGELGYAGLVEMDGGINLATLPLCARAGADVLVAGTAIFKEPDRKAVIASFRTLAEAERTRRVDP
jgi:ribulose-phosphate 3-epimerase